MKIDLYELLCAIKKGKSTNKGIAELASAINDQKVSRKVLESVHIGLSKMSDRDIKKFVDSL